MLEELSRLLRLASLLCHINIVLPNGRVKYARNASMAVLVGRAGRGQRNREEIGAEATDKPAVQPLA